MSVFSSAELKEICTISKFKTPEKAIDEMNRENKWKTLSVRQDNITNEFFW